MSFEKLEKKEDGQLVFGLLREHADYTQSPVAQKILDSWEQKRSLFVKVMPKDYRRVLDARKHAAQKGISEDEAVMEAAHG